MEFSLVFHVGFYLNKSHGNGQWATNSKEMKLINDNILNNGFPNNEISII